MNAPVRALAALLALTGIMTTATANENYRKKAEEISAVIQRDFYVPSEGLYRHALPREANELPYDFMWGNGVQFTNLVAATKHNPEVYRPVLYAFAKGLRRYWDTDAPIPGFDAYFSSPDHDDKYYDDNEWLVLGFVEAYEVTGDISFLNWARDTQDFVLSGWDDKLGGGIYWYQDKKSKNTCANGPAAASALRLLRVGHSEEDKGQLDWALRIRHWLNDTLKDKDGLYWDNINLQGEIEKTKWTYNTALMIRTDLLLYQTTSVKQYLTEARRMADASIAAWVNPETGAMQNSPRFTHLLSEALLHVYDVTGDPKYLNVVRRYADYAYARGRDPQGGFRDDWNREPGPKNRRLLIENASMARLYWKLSEYPDAAELVAQAQKRIEAREWNRAEPLLRQAVETAPDNIEARYRFWQTLNRLKKSEDADIQAARLQQLAADPKVKARLEGMGWAATAS